MKLFWNHLFLENSFFISDLFTSKLQVAKVGAHLDKVGKIKKITCTFPYFYCYPK